MKKINILAIILPFFTFAQTNNLNFKKHFFIGAQLGSNVINSRLEGVEFPTTFQGSLTAEYYFSRKWSVRSGIQYYKTGLSYNHPDPKKYGWETLLVLPLLSGDMTGYKPYQNLYFEGESLKMPLHLKWEFGIYKSLKGNLIVGTDIVTEVKRHHNVIGIENPDFSMFKKTYLGFSFGCGLSYYLNEKMAITYSYEYTYGGWKGATETVLWKTNLYLQNSFNSIGLKYSLGKK